MFLTGEFARIAQVSKRQLQYYDSIGLFSPEYTDPQTGYRSYNAHQLTPLNRILALKDLGFTLDQIAQLLNDGVTDRYIQTTLARQKEKLESKLIEDVQRLRRIEARLQRPPRDVPDVVLKTVEPQTMLSIHHFCLNPEEGIAFLSVVFERLKERFPQRTMGRFIGISTVDDFVTENVELEFGFFIDNDAPHEVDLADGFVLRRRILPAASQMATLVHEGNLQTVHLTYGVLGHWMDANRYRIVGQPREIFLGFPQPFIETALVIEIQIPVTPEQTTRPLAR